MIHFKLNKDKTICWWCGSEELTREHKSKKTEIEMLYGKVFSNGNLVNHIKYRTESKGVNIQSSKSDRVKFEKNLCKKCNGARSQDFDKAYQKLIDYYYKNRNEIVTSQKLDFEKIFGQTWNVDILNVKRYIGKHIGCRMAENGLLPSSNLIDFLNDEDINLDLKIIFQLKPYFIGQTNKRIESIFMGPANPINHSEIKFKNLVTSFCGWYTIANFTWNYLHEKGISKTAETSKVIDLHVVDYENCGEMKFTLNEKTLMKDWSLLLEKLEYFPFRGSDRDLMHYQFIKNDIEDH